MQVALGAVYAWSVFADPLAQAYGGASATAVNSTFSITIFTLGFAAFVGGLWMGNVGPRTVALTAGALYGVGIFLAGFASSSLVLLYLTYGFIAGAGIGLGYIVPVAKLVSSFGPFRTFSILGIIYLVMVVGAAFFMRNPPEGWTPEGWEPDTEEGGESSGVDYDLGGSLRTWQWYVLWALLFLNVTAGIAIITVASPMAVALAGVSATVAAGLVSIISVGNASGRFLWAWLSDAIGRKWVFFV